LPNSASAGSANHKAYEEEKTVRSGLCGNRLAELDVVEIVTTTAAELAPGVTGFGLKLHSEIAGAPEQDRVTALANDEPTGRTLKL
jgi:hypothetical protein